MNAIERGNNYAINVNGNNNKNYDKKKKKLFNDSFLWKCHFIWLFKKKNMNNFYKLLLIKDLLLYVILV